MINSKTFKNEIKDIVEKLYATQSANIDAAADLMTKSIENGGVIHIYGSGHSVGLGIDITNRTSCLIPIHIMEMTDFVYKGGISVEEFNDPVDVFERKPNMAGRLYNLYDIKPQDVFIIISNSGINGIVIDLAALAKEKGNKVVIITSMEHTLAETSRHPSGKKLYEYGDIVIDNCGPHGDALLVGSGIEKVTAVSSICNNVVAQTCALKIIENLNNDNYPLPVLTGDIEHDNALRKQYKGRI